LWIAYHEMPRLFRIHPMPGREFAGSKQELDRAERGSDAFGGVNRMDTA
jgi:hypothetical protein